MSGSVLSVRCMPGASWALGVHPVHPEIRCWVRLRPDSRLTLCVSGASDAPDPPDASYLFCWWTWILPPFKSVWSRFLQCCISLIHYNNSKSLQYYPLLCFFPPVQLMAPIWPFCYVIISQLDKLVITFFFFFFFFNQVIIFFRYKILYAAHAMA